MHGRGDTKDAWLNIRDTLDRMIAEGAIPPVIAVLPDMPSLSAAGYYIDSQYQGGEALESAFFNDLIPYVDSTYHTLVDPGSRIVGGYSMGGYGAMRYALARPEVFAGALILSPAVYTPLPLPIRACVSLALSARAMFYSMRKSTSNSRRYS